MIRLMMDSASDMNRNDPLCDVFVPISIHMSGKDYLDGVDLDKDTFYDMLQNSEDFPVTSQPSPQTFIDIFEEILHSGDEVIYFAISSALSGTYQGAMLAREMVGGYDEIHIVDTKGATHLIGVLVQYAAELRARGADAKSIVAACEELKNKIKIYAGVDTMEYLRKGGRLSNFAAVAATFAHLKPVVTLTENGKVAAVGKALGKARAMQWILERMKEAKIDRRFPIFTLYTCGGKNCAQLESKLKAMGEENFERKQIGSAIGAHAGPEVYGVLFVTQ